MTNPIARGARSKSVYMTVSAGWRNVPSCRGPFKIPMDMTAMARKQLLKVPNADNLDNSESSLVRAVGTITPALISVSVV